MHKIIAEIEGVYRGIFALFDRSIGILGLLLTILTGLFASRVHLLSEAALALLGVLLVVPICLGVQRALSSEKNAELAETEIWPPEAVRNFTAVSYAASSPGDVEELNRFALKKFGETFPADVIKAVVRNGSALGLRLIDDKGANIGFLDVYHFREEIFDLWRNGEIREVDMVVDQFISIRSIPNPADHDLKLVLGALFIDTANPVASYHLAHALIELAKDYLNFACQDFRSIVVHASIFNKLAGERWARKEGFNLDVLGGVRESCGEGHDVWKLVLKPRKERPRELIQEYGKKCEYRVGLRLQ